MEKETTLNAALALRDEIAREVQKHNGKFSKRARDLTDESAILLYGAMRAGFGAAVLNALVSRPLPADAMPEAAE